MAAMVEAARILIEEFMSILALYFFSIQRSPIARLGLPAIMVVSINPIIPMDGIKMDASGMPIARVIRLNFI